MIFTVAPLTADHIVTLAHECVGTLVTGDFPCVETAARQAAGLGVTLLMDGRPAACLGILKQWNGYGVAWTLISPRAAAHPVALIRIARRVLDSAFQTGGFRRIDSWTHGEWKAAHRLHDALGFTYQLDCPKYGPNGEMYKLYTRYATEEPCRL